MNSPTPNPYQPPPPPAAHAGSWWATARAKLHRQPSSRGFPDGVPVIVEGVAYFIDPQDSGSLHAAVPSSNASTERMNYIVAEATRLLPELLWEYSELQQTLRGRGLIVRMIRQYAELEDEIHSRVDAGTDVVTTAFDKLSEMPPRQKPREEPLRRGPALYVAASTLSGGIVSIPILVQQNPLGFLLILLGSLSGALVYRVRARHWPRDPAVRGQQVSLAWLIVVFVPALLMISGDTSPAGASETLIAGAVCGSFICGLLASGSRRDQAGYSTRTVDPTARVDH